MSGCGKHLSSLPLAVPRPTQACPWGNMFNPTYWPRNGNHGVSALNRASRWTWLHWNWAKREVKRGVERWAKLNVLLPQVSLEWLKVARRTWPLPCYVVHCLGWCFKYRLCIGIQYSYDCPAFFGSLPLCGLPVAKAAAACMYHISVQVDSVSKYALKWEMDRTGVSKFRSNIPNMTLLKAHVWHHFWNIYRKKSIKSQSHQNRIQQKQKYAEQ